RKNKSGDESPHSRSETNKSGDSSPHSTAAGGRAPKPDTDWVLGTSPRPAFACASGLARPEHEAVEAAVLERSAGVPPGVSIGQRLSHGSRVVAELAAGAVGG